MPVPAGAETFAARLAEAAAAGDAPGAALLAGAAQVEAAAAGDAPGAALLAGAAQVEAAAAGDAPVAALRAAAGLAETASAATQVDADAAMAEAAGLWWRDWIAARVAEKFAVARAQAQARAGKIPAPVFGAGGAIVRRASVVGRGRHDAPKSKPAAPVSFLDFVGAAMDRVEKSAAEPLPPPPPRPTRAQIFPRLVAAEAATKRRREEIADAERAMQPVKTLWNGAIGPSLPINKGVATELLHRARPHQPVSIFLNSGGGDLRIALAIGEILRQHKGKVTVTATVQASSAALIILASAHDRAAWSDCVFFFHRAAIEGRITADMMRASVDNLERLEILMTSRLAIRCCTSTTRIQALCASETTIGAAEAVELGLVHRIVHRVRSMEAA